MKYQLALLLSTAFLALPSARADLVGLWSLDGDAKDKSGNNLNGEATDVTYSSDVPTALKTGKSAEFTDGSVIEIPHNVKLDITNGITISAWVKPVGNVAWDGVIAKNPSDESGPNHAGNYELRIENGTRVLTFLYQRGDANDTASVASTGKVKADVWQHVAVTAVKGGDCIFYIDGIAVGTRTVPDTFGATNTNPLFIGSRNDKFTPMNGFIDEVALYNEALTPSSIAALAQGPVSLDTTKDTDKDGMPDVFEKQFAFLNPNDASDAAKDQDGDGASNGKEYLNQTDLAKADTDGDGVKDGAETKTGVFVSANDTGTDPKKADTDGDGLSDGVEKKTGKFVSATDTGTDPLKIDTDGDGLSDKAESGTGKFVSASDTGSDPNKTDTDGDGADDGAEVGNSTNPTDPASKPSGGVAIAGIVGLWRFDAGGVDSSGNGLTGQLVNGAVYDADVPTSLKGGKSLKLDGQGHFLVPHNTKLDVTGGEITLAAWVKPVGNAGWDGILAKNPSEGSGDNHAGNYELRIQDGGRQPQFLYETGSPNTTQTHGPSEELVIEESVWTHLVATAKAGGDLKFYINGKLANTNEGIIREEFGPANTNPLYIGSRQDLFTGFDGLIDDVAIFRRVLTDSEIQSIFKGEYTLGAAGDADRDGLPDDYEKQFPAFLSASNAADAALDQDKDGLSNLDEFKKGTAPDKADTDGDGLNDKAETGTGTFVSATDTGSNALLADTDKDGLSDGAEVNGTNAKSYKSDPNKLDTDGDSFGDGAEVAKGSNPADPKSTPGAKIVGLWTFDAPGATQPDKSGNKHDAAVTGATWIQDAARKGGVMSFGEGEQYLEVQDTPALSITGDITIAAWVNVESFDGFRGIVGKTQVNQPAPYDLYLVQGEGIARFYLGNGVGQNGQSSSTAAPEVGTWQHVLVTKTGNDVTHYLNGEENGKGTVRTTIADTDGPLRIGNRMDGVTQFAGRMDDVVIIDGAITAAQAKAIMAGDYTSLSSGGGTVTAPAGFRVTKAELLADLNLRVTWGSEAGKNYLLEFSRDLKTWQTLQDNIASQGASSVVTAKLTAGAVGFARVRQK